MWCGGIAENFDLGNKPTTKEAQAIGDELFAAFVSEDVDKVEMVYTKFVSLIASDPIVQTMLPLTPAGEICDVQGNCVVCYLRPPPLPSPNPIHARRPAFVHGFFFQGDLLMVRKGLQEGARRGTPACDAPCASKEGEGLFCLGGAVAEDLRRPCDELDSLTVE